MKVFVKNKFWSLRQGSDVLDENKQPVFKVKGKWPSIRKRKFISTLNNELLYEVRNKFWHFFYPTAFIFNNEGEKIATVRKKLISMRTQFFIEGMENEFKIDGNFIGWNLTVYKDDKEFGKISRNFDLFKDCFTVEANDEDIPFMLALTIALDNMADKSRKSQH